MSTDEDFDENTDVQAQTMPDFKIIPVNEMPPYHLRNMFREILMTYFEQTDKRDGSYIWAEAQAIDYFQKFFGIHPQRWSYRTRRV